MPIHCTAPWVGGYTAPPSPPTAGPYSGKETEGLSHNRGVLQSCEVGGAALLIHRGNTITDLHFSTQCQYTRFVPGVMHCSTLHLCSILPWHIITFSTSNHTPLDVSNHPQVCEEGTSRQSWFSSSKLAIASGNENR